MSFAKDFYTHKGINPHNNDNRYNPGRVPTSYNSQEIQNAYRKDAKRHAEKVKRFTNEYQQATNDNVKLRILENALISDIHLSDPESIPQPLKPFQAIESKNSQVIEGLKQEIRDFLYSYRYASSTENIKEAIGKMKILMSKLHSMEQPELIDEMTKGIIDIKANKALRKGGRRTHRHKKSHKKSRKHHRKSKN